MHVMAALLLGMGAILLFVKFWRIFVPIAVVGGVIAAVLFGGFVWLANNSFEREKHEREAASKVQIPARCYPGGMVPATYSSGDETLAMITRAQGKC